MAALQWRLVETRLGHDGEGDTAISRPASTRSFFSPRSEGPIKSTMLLGSHMARSFGEGCDSLDQYFPFSALSSVKCSDIKIFLSSWELPMKRVAEAFSNVRKAQYDIKLNNAILAEEKHLPMYDELASKGSVDYGVYCWRSATHNSISWMLQIPGATCYMGCCEEVNIKICRKKVLDPKIT